VQFGRQSDRYGKSHILADTQDAALNLVRSELRPRKQPDLQWYFDTAATPAENQGKVLEAVRTASEHVQRALRLGTEDGKIVWWWPMLTLLASKS
jgi:hypothetical protein